MAVSLGELAVALRIQVDPTADVAEPEKSILERLQGWAAEEIKARAPGATESARDNALVLLVSYLYDRPGSTGGAGFSNAWDNSGASNVLRRFVKRRAVVLSEDAAGAVGRPDNGGTVDGGGSGDGLNRAEVDARIAAGVQDWAETGNPDPIPASKLANAPRSGGGGLNEGQVDARVSALVQDWAETGNNTRLPSIKLPVATKSAAGAAAIATDSEIDAETDDTAKFLSVRGVLRAIARKVKNATAITVGLVRFASTVEARGGTSTNTVVTPAQMKDYVARNAGGGNGQGTGTDSVARADAQANSEAIARNVSLIARLQDVTKDLTVVRGSAPLLVPVDKLSEASLSYFTAPSGSKGGNSIDQPDTGWANDRRIFVRLSDNVHRAQYQVVFVGNAQVDNEEFVIPGGTWHQDTRVTQNGYTFWRAGDDAPVGENVARVELRVIPATTEYSGNVPRVITNRQAVGVLETLTRDIHDPGADLLWSNMGPLLGGLAAAGSVRDDSDAADSAITGLTYAPIINQPANGWRSDQRYIIASIPRDADPGNYRSVLTPRNPSFEAVEYNNGNTWRKLDIKRSLNTLRDYYVTTFVNVDGTRYEAPPDGATYGRQLASFHIEVRTARKTTYDGVFNGTFGQDVLDVIRALVTALAPASGLDQSAVDARVKAGVLDWAEQGNTSVIPAAKLPAASSGTDVLKISFDGGFSTVAIPAVCELFHRTSVSYASDTADYDLLAGTDGNEYWIFPAKQGDLYGVDLEITGFMVGTRGSFRFEAENRRHDGVSWTAVNGIDGLTGQVNVTGGTSGDRRPFVLRGRFFVVDVVQHLRIGIRKTVSAASNVQLSQVRCTASFIRNYTISRGGGS